MVLPKWLMRSARLRVSRWNAEGVDGVIDRQAHLYDYARALFIFAVAVLLRIALDQVVPERFVLATFLPAVLIAAYLYPLGPSILVLVLASATAAAWIEPPLEVDGTTFYTVGFFYAFWSADS